MQGGDSCGPHLGTLLVRLPLLRCPGSAPQKWLRRSRSVITRLLASCTASHATLGCGFVQRLRQPQSGARLRARRVRIRWAAGSRGACAVPAPLLTQARQFHAAHARVSTRRATCIACKNGWAREGHQAVIQTLSQTAHSFGGWADATSDATDAVPSLMLAGPREADAGWSSARATTRVDGTAQAPSAREQMQAAQSGSSPLVAPRHSAAADSEDTSAVEAALVSLAGPAPLDHATCSDGLQYGSTVDWQPAVHTAVAETHASKEADECWDSNSGSECGAIGTTAARSWAQVEIDMFSWAHASRDALRCVPRSGRRGSAVDADVALRWACPRQPCWSRTPGALPGVNDADVRITSA